MTKRTIELDDNDWWLIRDAIAASTGGKTVTSLRKKHRLVHIAEHVILRKLLGLGELKGRERRT